MRLIHFLLLASLTFSSAALAEPQFKIYNSQVWYDGSTDAALPRALVRGEVRYFISRDDGTPSVDLAFDFEAALLTWLRALGLERVTVARADATGDADVVVHFGPKDWVELPSGMQGHPAHHYRDSYGLRPDKVISVIEVGSAKRSVDDYAWTSIRQARAADALTREMQSDGQSPSLKVAAVFGDGETPAAVASRLVERKPVIIYGDLAKAKGEYRRIVFWTFLHELGHAFGLADLYAYPGNEGKAPEYASIMRDMEWAPLVPTKTDLERVRERIKTSGLCDHLLD